MPTLVLGRPLTFGDEEQINFIKENEGRIKLTQNSEFLSLKKEYNSKCLEKEELEDEIDELYNELANICVNMGIDRNDCYKFI